MFMVALPDASTGADTVVRADQVAVVQALTCKNGVGVQYRAGSMVVLSSGFQFKTTLEVDKVLARMKECRVDCSD